MFQGATEFNSTISDWDTCSVTTMSTMFQGASQFNVEVLDWDKKETCFICFLKHLSLMTIVSIDTHNTVSSTVTIDLPTLLLDKNGRILTSGLTTGVVSLLMEDVFDNLASSLATGVVSLRKEDVLDKLGIGSYDRCSISSKERYT